MNAWIFGKAYNSTPFIVFAAEAVVLDIYIYIEDNLRITFSCTPNELSIPNSRYEFPPN